MEKYNLSSSDILSKLALIEKHLDGFTIGFYEVSSDFKPEDVMSVHREASKMLKFVGLNTQTPFIAYTNTGENTGGQIDLDNSDDVYIEISDKYKYDPGKTLAVMAHEICHKVLYVHNLYYPYNVIENELLTDLATVYVGFGKLSLNGCYNEKKDYQFAPYNGNMLKQETTTTEYVGYLSLRQFATAYSMVCSIYGIDVETMESGLNAFALSELRSIHMGVREKIAKNDIQEKLKLTQKVDAAILRDVVLLNKVLDGMRVMIKQRHQRYKNDFIFPFEGNSDEINKQIVAAELFATYGEEPRMQEQVCAMDDLLKALNRYHKIDESVLLDVECPNCGYKKPKALKENKEVFIKCPNCKYTFVWDGRSMAEKDVRAEKLQTQKSISWVDKIRNLFVRHLKK